MVQIYDRDERKFIHEKLKELKNKGTFNWESSVREKQAENLSLVHYIDREAGTLLSSNSFSILERFQSNGMVSNSVVEVVIDYICLFDEEFSEELGQYHTKKKRVAARKKAAARKKDTTTADGVTISDVKSQTDTVPQSTAKGLPIWQSIPPIKKAGALSVAVGVIALALFWSKDDSERSLPEGEAPQSSSSQSQKPPKSDRERALAKLAARGIPVIYASLNSAVLSADADILQLLHAAGISDSALKKAFSDKKVVIAFFESSRDSSASLAWFKNVALKILDVNKLIGTGDDQTSIIYYAIKSSNVGAVRALLENGANPYAYQKLFLSSYTITPFIHPYTYVLRNSSIPTDAKKQLFNLLKQHGVVHINPGSEVQRDGFALDRQSDVLKNDFKRLQSGFKITPGTQKSICTLNKSRWCGGKLGKKSADCKIISAVPKSFSIFGRDYRSLGNVDVMNYIGRYEDKGYFIVRLPQGYGLLEGRQDLLQIRVYGVIRPAAGMGLCKPFDSDPKYNPKRCWRRITIDTVPQDGQISAMLLSNHYKFQIKHCKAAN